MARGIRIEYPGAFYHVMARGNRRENIFLDDDDRRFFLLALSQACEMTGWRVHAWVLMGNHYHLFIETPEGNLVAGMKWLQNTYTRRFNVRHRAWGRVFGDRYKAVIVQGDAANYYQTLMDYIHLNPVRAKLIQPKEKQSVLDYPWSSLAGGYALPPTKRALWLAADYGLKSFGLDDTTAGRRRMVERLDRRAVEEEAMACGVPMLPGEMDSRTSHLRRGWFWGSQAFAEKMLKLAADLLPKKKARAFRSSSVAKAHHEGQALAWLEEGRKAADMTLKELKALKSTDPRKAAIAQLLWTRTTVNQAWIAERLGMSSAANVSQVLKRASIDEEQLPSKLADWLESVKR